MSTGKFSMEIPVEIDATEVMFDVDYTYSPGDPGCMYQHNGDPGWPPEPPEIEICEMKTKDGETVPHAIYNAFANGDFMHDWIAEHHQEPEPPEYDRDPVEDDYRRDPVNQPENIR